MVHKLVFKVEIDHNALLEEDAEELMAMLTKLFWDVIEVANYFNSTCNIAASSYVEKD